MTFHSTTQLRPAAIGAGAFPLAGPYGWATPYIAAIAAQNDDVRSRQLFLARDELHFIALCLSLMGAKRDDPDHLAAFARSYSVLTRKSLVATAADLGNVRAAPALANVAQRLSGKIWRRPSYLRLAALMNEPHARKVLAHLPRVSRRHVAVLTKLPPEYRTAVVVAMITRRKELGEVKFAIDLVRRIRTDLDDRQIVASLGKVTAANISEWVMKHYRQVPFPGPPVGALVIEGVEALRPLVNYGDIARAAREFDNCIRTYLFGVLKGESYFYRYAPDAGGKGVAIIELRRVPAIGWVVHEAYGPKTTRSKVQTARQFLRRFVNAASARRRKRSIRKPGLTLADQKGAFEPEAP